MRNTDIILLIPLLWGISWGFYKGLISQIASLLGMIVAVYFAAKYYNVLAVLINTHIDNKMSRLCLTITAFAVIFIAVVLLIYFLSKQIEKLTKALHIGFVNHIAGALFGLFKWAFILSIFIALMNRFSHEINHPLINFQSTWLYSHVAMIAPAIIPALLGKM